MELSHSSGGCVGGPVNHDESGFVLFQNFIEMTGVFGRILFVRQGVLSPSVAGDNDEIGILDEAQILGIVQSRFDLELVGAGGLLEFRFNQQAYLIVVV